MIDESGFKQSQCQISIYYKYTLDVSNLIVLSYVDDYIYWYTYVEPVKLFVYTLVNIFHMNFQGYSNWFMSIIISQLKDHSISVDQSRYDTYFFAKYLYAATKKENSKFHKTTLPYLVVLYSLNKILIPVMNKWKYYY